MSSYWGVLVTLLHMERTYVEGYEPRYPQSPPYKMDILHLRQLAPQNVQGDISVLERVVRGPPTEKNIRLRLEIGDRILRDLRNGTKHI